MTANVLQRNDGNAIAMSRRQNILAVLPIIILISSACSAGQNMKCGIAMQAEADKDYELLRDRAYRGDHCAELSLARAYFLGDDKLERDADKALGLAQRSASSGLAIAQYELALMYMGGRDINADYEKVVYWLTEAANQGYIPAQTSLGRMLVDGRLVERDIQKGLRLLLEADKNGGAVAGQLLVEMADAIARPGKGRKPASERN
ncbi:MAG: tetratricopeptide repeat protein [Gammaproteobacteria bacterium]|nr:tetratricopeptide repeat protein [Gammaproteobacteria bacterium]